MANLTGIPFTTVTVNTSLADAKHMDSEPLSADAAEATIPEAEEDADDND